MKCLVLLYKHCLVLIYKKLVSKGGDSECIFVTPVWFLWPKTVYRHKLDGVGPVDNRPSTDKTNHFEEKNKKKKVTCDTWHVTRDIWNVTCNMWHVTCCGGWPLSQNFNSLALLICDLWYFKDQEEKAHWLNQWINEWFTRLIVEEPQLHRVCEILWR